MHTFCSVTCTVVAKAVLDRCMETNAVSEEDRTKIKVEFNYEFLEDNKKWREHWMIEDKATKKIKERPLALMVS